MHIRILFLQELEDIYNDVCLTLSDAVLQGAEVVASRVRFKIVQRF